MIHPIGRCLALPRLERRASALWVSDESGRQLFFIFAKVMTDSCFCDSAFHVGMQIDLKL